MLEIPVRVNGDHWLNPEQVSRLLEHHSETDVIYLDLGAEGASLAALGIERFLLDYCDRHQREPSTLFINNWSNNVEATPFTRANQHVVSHFFWLSQRYWLDQIPNNTGERRFGYFMGRRSPSRIMMLYDICHAYAPHALISVMRVVAQDFWQCTPPGFMTDRAEDWCHTHDIARVRQWWQSQDLPSLDGHYTSDQYRPEHNTNRDLLQHYHRFDVEIVAETFCLGSTFFPTEKTVRPIMACRPFLVYGPRGYLSRLRDLGFRTYHTLWDETYDDRVGPERWQYMRCAMDFIGTNWPSIEAQALEIARHNRQRLQELIQQHQPR